MLYTVSLDSSNYILSVAHTKNDDTELNLEEMELEYLSAYKMTDGSAVLDLVKKAELIAEEAAREKQEQIDDLIQQLESSNDEMLEFVEDLFSLKNPLTFISDMFTLMKNYTALVTERQSIRQQIKELQK